MKTIEQPHEIYYQKVVQTIVESGVRHHNPNPLPMQHKKYVPG
jgi:hypothetical protein